MLCLGLYFYLFPSYECPVFQTFCKIVLEAQPISSCFHEFKLAASACKIPLSSQFIFYYYIIVFEYLCYSVLLVSDSCVLYLFLIFPTRLYTSWSYHLISKSTQCFYSGRYSHSIYLWCYNKYMLPTTYQALCKARIYIDGNKWFLPEKVR